MKPGDQDNFQPAHVTLKDGKGAPIRPLSKNDAKSLAEFYRTVPRKDYRFYCPYPLDDERAMQNAAGASDPFAIVLVLQLPNGSIGGYAWCRWRKADDRKCGFGICVRPDCQNAGAGRALMAQLLASAKTIAPPVMCLTVQKANARGLALYTKMGFSIVREQIRPENKETGFPAEPEFYMERSLRDRQ